ncbi:MAG TPA: hypothetical protein VHR86_09285, partial [Armatimonadota bacterium]|nr:hypothetical protein [Armatimonadota bacterium]
LIAPEDQELRARLVEQGVSPLICEAGLEADACAEGLSLLPRPRLRQVDRLVAQNEGAAGILGQRIMPATQFVTDFVLMQKLLHPELANHEILRELGSCLYTETAYIFDFARAIWMLNSWWESGLRGELSEVDEGLSALPPDSLGMVAPLRDSVQLLRDLVYYLESGERHFDALVARVHARMADSPLFQGYTLDRVWQTRARNAVSAQVASWLEYLRRHLERAGV